jgi:hypothetical protein
MSENEFLLSDDSSSEEDEEYKSFMQYFEQRRGIEVVDVDDFIEEEEITEVTTELEGAPGRIDLQNISRKTKNAGWSLADFSTRNLVETSELSGPRNIPSNNSSAD